MREPRVVPATSLIHFSLNLDRKIRAWFILIFGAFLAVYIYFGIVRVQERLVDRRSIQSSLSSADSYDRPKFERLLSENTDQITRDLSVRMIPFLLCTALLFLILTSMKTEFRDFLSELGARERLLKSKDRSKQLILESLSEGILEFDLHSATWVTISGKFLEVFYGSRVAPLPLEFLENGLRAWVNLAPLGDREKLSQILIELSRNSGLRTIRISYDFPHLGNRTIELRIFSRLKGKNRRTQNGIIAISHRDVSDIIRLEQDRQDQERMLAETNDRMRFALDSMKLGVWEWDLGTNTLHWDDRARQMFEFFENHEPTFDNFIHRVHPDDQAAVKRAALEGMRTRAYLEISFRVVTEDHRTKYIRSKGKIQLDDHGNPAKVTGLYWDVTEETLKDREYQDAKARQLSSAKLAAIGEMASGIAHEINNPLTVIGAKSMLIARRVTKGTDPENLQALENDLKCVEENVFRISKIVKGLKIFSRDGERDPMENVRIATIIDDALGFCTERFKLHRVDLQVENELSSDLRIKCRSTQLGQILLNLLNNAFDATAGLPERRVSVRLFEEKGRAHILVSDNGPGVPDEIAERIMQPFFTTKEVGKGSGLGLSISQSIARDHGGELFLDRRRGNSCFHLSLPLAGETELLKAG